jgi:hypothetical protein
MERVIKERDRKHEERKLWRGEEKRGKGNEWSE